MNAADAGTWKLGDLAIHRMGFGAMRLTADPDPTRALQVLERALELGVNHIDTAAFYVSPGGTLGVSGGPYRAANLLINQALAPYPAGLVITTKIGPGYDKNGEWGEATSADALRYQVEENLRMLGRDMLDVVNLRIVYRTVPLEERFEALAALQAEGLIRHLGLSNVRPEEVEALSRIAPVVCVQNSYSVDHRRDQDAFVAWCGEHGIAFVPFFAIAGAGRESGATEAHSEALLDIARELGATPHQIRLAWTLHQGQHVLAIPGTGDPAHLEQNIAAAALRLSDSQLAALG